MERSAQERLTDGLTASILECIRQSGGQPLSQQCQDHTINEICRRKKHVDAQTILQEAQERAFALWKEHTEKIEHRDGDPAPDAMSLFLNQLNSGGLTFVTWPMIQEQATTDDERLALLLRIDYLDDILPDWSEIRDFAQQHWRPQVVQLHRKWYDLSRSSGEYKAFQEALLENLIEAVKNDKTRKLCVTTLLDILQDCADQNASVEPSTIFTLFCWLADDTIRNLIMEHGPHAQAFCKWIMNLSPNETLSVVNDGMLLRLYKLSLDSEASVFCLSVLRSVLVSTRVLRFPWNALSFSWDDLLLLYLKTLYQHSSNDRVIAICTDAMDTLCNGRTAPLSECCTREIDEFETALPKAQAMMRLMERLKKHGITCTE